MESNGFSLAAEEQRVNCKQFGFVRSTLPGYKNVISDVCGLERGEVVMVPATESREAGATRQLRREQKSNSRVQKLVSRLRPPGDLVVSLFARAFLTAVTCFRVQFYRELAGYEADPEIFRVAKEIVLRQFAKAALDAGTDAKLS